MSFTSHVQLSCSKMEQNNITCSNLWCLFCSFDVTLMLVWDLCNVHCKRNIKIHLLGLDETQADAVIEALHKLKYKSILSYLSVHSKEQH